MRRTDRGQHVAPRTQTPARGLGASATRTIDLPRQEVADDAAFEIWALGDQQDPAPGATRRRLTALLLWITIAALSGGTAAQAWSLWPSHHARTLGEFTGLAPSTTGIGSSGVPAPSTGTTGPWTGAAGSTAPALGPRTPAPSTIGATTPVTDTRSDAQVLAAGRQSASVVAAPAPSCTAANTTTGEGAACRTVRVRLLSGPQAGTEVSAAAPEVTGAVALRPGQHLVVTPVWRAAATAGAAPVLGYDWTDQPRGLPMTLLGCGFLLALLVVARLRGLTTLAGLAAGIGMLVWFVAPALARGESPLAVSLTSGLLTLMAVGFLGHGPIARTGVAVIGASAGLSTAAVLAWWGSSAAHLSATVPTTADGLPTRHGLSLLPGGLDLHGAVLAGLVLAGVGAVLDLALAQAAAVWTAVPAEGGDSFRALFRTGMRSGAGHLTSVLHTVAFAAAAVALPLLVLSDLDRPFVTETLTSATVAVELVRVAAVACGLLVAMPATTALAALCVPGLRTVAPASAVMTAGAITLPQVALRP